MGTQPSIRPLGTAGWARRQRQGEGSLAQESDVAGRQAMWVCSAGCGHLWAGWEPSQLQAAGLPVPSAGMEKPPVAQDVGLFPAAGLGAPLLPGGLLPGAQQPRADHGAWWCSARPGMQPTPAGWQQEAPGNLEGSTPVGVKGAPTQGSLAASRRPQQAAPVRAGVGSPPPLASLAPLRCAGGQGGAGP